MDGRSPTRLDAKLAFEATLPERGTWAGVRMLGYTRPWNVLAAAFDSAVDNARAPTRANARQRAPTRANARRARSFTP